MQNLMIVFSIIFCLFAQAEVLSARCMMPTDDFKETIKIQDSWSSRHTHEGSLYGCIVKAENRSGKSFFAYTPYKFLCEIPKTEWIEIEKLHACCDAGDDGDFSCGVKPINPLAGIQRLSITIRPAKPDARAIPDLMNHLESSKFGAKLICYRLHEHFLVPALQPKIKSLIPKLKSLLQNSESRDVKSAIAQLLLDIDPHSDKTELQKVILQGVGYQFDTASYNALVGVFAGSKITEDHLKLLLSLLQQVKTDAKSLEVVVNALYKHKTELKPYLSHLHAALSDLPENKNALNYWNQLACESFGDTKVYRKILWEKDENRPATECPSKKNLLPSMKLEVKKQFNDNY